LSHRLLCVTAHPDDESGGFGGALLMSHRDGVDTSILCMTDGQAAHFRGSAADAQELGRMRRAELDAACTVLGVTHHEVLHYPDGELARQDFYSLVGVVIERIRRWRPQVILTFGGDGAVNLHRDHTMISAVTTAAFHWANRPEMFPEQPGLPAYAPQKLYYASTPFVSVRARPELANAATVPYSLTLELGSFSERKMEAFGKHHSQQGVLQRVGKQVQQSMRYERYLLAARRGQTSVMDDTAIFNGVVEDAE